MSEQLRNPKYRAAIEAARLTDLERSIITRYTTTTSIGFHQIGLEHGLSDKQARQHFDAALAKVRPHLKGATT